jgi:hypothetical protein
MGHPAKNLTSRIASEASLKVNNPK